MEKQKFKPHISKKKERIVNDLVTLIKEYPVVGILDMTNLPALQFQRIRSKLKEKLEFRMVKKRLIKIAFDKVKDEKKGIEQLKEKLEGIPALIFTKEDPFKIAKAIKKEVSSAPAKPGQIAPDDLSVPAGPTPFTPGPMIGELGAMGIKTKVENGKISVIDDKVLVKKGEEVNSQSADLLAKLGVEPMQIGFNLLLTYKDGEILLKDVLFVDEKLYIDTLKQYANESFNLAMHIEYMCKETATRLISKAENEAKALDSKVDLKVEVKEEKVEEKPVEPVEEKKEEPPVEQPKPVEEKPQEEPKEEVKEEPKPEPIEEKKEEQVVEEPKIEEPKQEGPKEEEPVEEEVKKEPEIVDKRIEGEIKEEKGDEFGVLGDNSKNYFVNKEELKETLKIGDRIIFDALNTDRGLKAINIEKIEYEKPQEEVKEDKKEEVKEEKPEEKKLEEVKKEEEVKVGLKPGKDISKEDMDLAAKQLQQIQDNLINKGK